MGIICDNVLCRQWSRLHFWHRDGRRNAVTYMGDFPVGHCFGRRLEDPSPMLNSISNERSPRISGAGHTVLGLDQSKANVLATLPSAHSRRSNEHAISRFIEWYCSEPRLGFNRSTVVRYRSFLESLGLAPATNNLHLSAIRRLADESTESGWLSPELATGIRRVRGVGSLGGRSAIG